MFRRRHRLGVDHASAWRLGKSGSGAGASSGPRVLIESEDGAEATALVHLLEAQGYRPSWCPGPDGSNTCPLVHDGRCELVDGADAVVSTLNLAHAACREVLAAQATSCPDTPVLVVTSRASASRWAHLLTGRRMLRLPLTARSLVSSLADLFGSAGRGAGARPGLPHGIEPSTG